MSPNNTKKSSRKLYLVKKINIDINIIILAIEEKSILKKISYFDKIFALKAILKAARWATNTGRPAIR